MVSAGLQIVQNTQVKLFKYSATQGEDVDKYSVGQEITEQPRRAVCWVMCEVYRNSFDLLKSYQFCSPVSRLTENPLSTPAQLY